MNGKGGKGQDGPQQGKRLGADAHDEQSQPDHHSLEKMKTL